MVSNKMSIHNFSVNNNDGLQGKDLTTSELSINKEKSEHSTPTEPVANAEDVTPPWHFKLLVIGTVGYLIYRFIWFIFLLTGHAWSG